LRGGGGSLSFLLDSGSTADRRFSAAEDLVGEDEEEEEGDKQIWARSPSTCRRPLRIRCESREERLSNARDRRASIVYFCLCLGNRLSVLERVWKFGEMKIKMSMGAR